MSILYALRDPVCQEGHIVGIHTAHSTVGIGEWSGVGVSTADQGRLWGNPRCVGDTATQHCNVISVQGDQIQYYHCRAIRTVAPHHGADMQPIVDALRDRRAQPVPSHGYTEFGRYVANRHTARKVTHDRLIDSSSSFAGERLEGCLAPRHRAERRDPSRLF